MIDLILYKILKKSNFDLEWISNRRLELWPCGSIWLNKIDRGYNLHYHIIFSIYNRIDFEQNYKLSHISM